MLTGSDWITVWTQLVSLALFIPFLQTVENISNLSASGLCPPVQVGLAVLVVVGSGSY